MFKMTVQQLFSKGVLWCVMNKWKFLVPNDIRPPTMAIAILLSRYHKPTSQHKQENSSCNNAHFFVFHSLFFKFSADTNILPYFPACLMFQYVYTYTYMITKFVNAVSSLLSSALFSFRHSEKRATSFFLQNNLKSTDASASKKMFQFSDAQKQSKVPLYQFVHRIVYTFKRGPSYQMTTLSQLSPFAKQNH